MSLPLDHPVVETGDGSGFFQAWRVERPSDENTNRGRLYAEAAQEADPSSTTGGTQIRVRLYRDVERTILVAQGTGQRGTRIALQAEADYDIEASVHVSLTAILPASGKVVVFVAFAGVRDIEGAEDHLGAMRLQEPTEVDFDSIRLRVMQRFYVLMQSVFPPPVAMQGPLDFADASPIQLRGSMGLPDITAVDLWSMNNEGDWELTGLENPGDYRLWFVAAALEDIWRRRAGSGADPAFQKAVYYEQRAMELFKQVLPNVDIDRDGLPERPVRRRTGTLRRG